ncbi:MAG: autotransporter outer membrane beta-barrel domain-containing protein [Alphaproteobacteria bacterium]|nr:autotransporter outer membrane beta-barrel domain-containing protein [Alphaproteobacteria bacterium]
MLLKRFLFCFLLVVTDLFAATSLGQALPFADYVYQNVRQGKIAAVQSYLDKGYRIDAVNHQGKTALCLAAENQDYASYRKLIRMGASVHHNCMSEVDMRTFSSYGGQSGQALARTAKAGTGQISLSDHTTAYVVGGVLAAGAVAAVALSGGGGGGHHSHSAGGDSGKEEIIECPTGTKLEGNECVAIECPTGTKLEGNECVAIKCPRNTHLVGNLCVADENIDINEQSDEPLYGIASEAESIYNLYSSPSYPDDEDTIVLKNKGDGDVFGLYGYSGEVFNSYVIGYSENKEHINEKPIGTGTIKIQDDGRGTVYGMYSHIADITQYKEAINAAGWNEGTAYGNIDITHVGGGATYGLAGDVRAYNAYAAYGGKSYGQIKIKGDGDIYGIHGYVAATNAVSPWYGKDVKGSIEITSEGDGDIYGMMINKDDIPGAGAGSGNLASWFAFNAYTAGGDVEADINIHNTGDGNVYGMYGGQQLYNAMYYGAVDADGKTDGSSIGRINVTNFGKGNVYGMYMPEADSKGIISNISGTGSASYINLINSGDGVATGMRGGKYNSITNSGEININNVGEGTAVGIYAEQNSVVQNSGKINIYREAFVDSIDGKEYQPNSAVGGTAYGIYAESGAKVYNKGTIVITGAENGAGIYLEEGARLDNEGVVRFNEVEDSIVQNQNAADVYRTGSARRTEVNLASFGGGEIVLGKEGKFFAQSLSGDMKVSADAVKGGFDNQYVLAQALQVQDVEKLQLTSQSALFTADKVQSDGGYDVVLNRQSFAQVMKDSHLGHFLDENYEQKNNEIMYETLKKANTQSSLQKQAVQALGADILPGFRQENARLYGALSRQFDDSLFNHPEKSYVGGYKYVDVSHEAKGYLQESDGTAHAAYGLLTGRHQGFLYGIGATAAQFKTDYDNHSHRKSNVFGLWAPIGYDFANGSRWVTKFYAGYEDGSYRRLSLLRSYSADVKSYQYGLSNALRHDIALGKHFYLTPTAELNFLGIHQKGFDEGHQQGAIHTKDVDSLSLEGGIGAYISKDFKFNTASDLTIKIGGIYYVEFLHPDEDIKASQSGMSGHYKISHHSDDARALFSARVRYNYKNIAVLGTLEQETNNHKAKSINLDVLFYL